MKVCFISHLPDMAGGAEKSLIETIDALNSKGVDCFVLLRRHGELAEELKRREVAFAVIPYELWIGRMHKTILRRILLRIFRTMVNLSMFFFVAQKIKENCCDIVYTNTSTVSVGAVAASLLRLPHIWHLREFGSEDHNIAFDLGQRFSCWLMKQTNCFYIANSHAIAQKYKKLLKTSKIKVVYQAVGNKEVKTISVDSRTSAAFKQKLNCIIVGRIHKGKGQEDAIRAIAELASQGIIVQLVIVGDGDSNYIKYCHDLVVENKIESLVKFTGYTPASFPMMQTADVVLVCSRNEAFGRVTIEAMKAGTPVIGANSGGTTELICDGYNGYLYSPGNYKELAEKIKYFHKDSQLAEQMGLNGYRWASKRFTQDRYGEEVLSILNQVVNIR